MKYQVKDPQGQLHIIDGPEGASQDEIISQAQKLVPSSPSPQGEGSVMSFIRAAGNQMPLGPQFSALVSPGSYSQNMASQNNAIAQDKANHPVAYGSGAVTGAVAPALIPGVGPLMTANPLTAGAVIGGSGAIANTDVTKNPVQSAKDAGMGMATGALLGGVLNKLMPPVQQRLESNANTLANKSVNMPSGVLEKMTEAERQSQGSMLRNSGVIVKDKELARDNAIKLLKNYGESISKVANTAEGQGLTADPVQHYSFITDLLEKAKKFVGSENNINKALGRQYKAGAGDIANLGDNPTWHAIQDLKEVYGQTAFKESGTQAQKDTYFALSDMLKGISEKAQSDPSLGAKYKEALAGYSRMSPIVDGLRDTVDSELRGKGGHAGHAVIGLIKKLPGEARAVIGAAGLATGHPHYALAAALPELLNPAIQSNAIGGLARSIPAIQNIATLGSANAATTPEAQSKIYDLLNQLKQKYDQRRSF